MQHYNSLEPITLYYQSLEPIMQHYQSQKSLVQTLSVAKSIMYQHQPLKPSCNNINNGSRTLYFIIIRASKTTI
jgi:hypothetical protein